MTILATCATIAAALAAANGGETIELRGDCPALTIKKHYARELVINADRASIRGLTVTGSDITFNGGTIVASGGTHGAGPSGYGVKVQGARAVTFNGVTFRDAKKGAVVDSSQDVAFVRSVFTRLGDDGIVVARSTGVRIAGNLFELAVGKPTECTIIGAETQYSLSMKACVALGGTWKDGYHPDAVQMRNAVKDALLERNIVRGSTQGLTQMDTTGDLPLERITIRRNSIITDGYHPITLKECLDCRIEENEVLRLPGSAAKKVIHAGTATRCGNVVQDEKVQDAPCGD